MTGWPLLSTITFLPLAGALWILFFVRHEDEALAAKNARSMALWASLVTFAVSLFLWFRFDRDSADFQFVERADCIPAFNISYHMRVDGISMMLLLLSNLLTPLCVRASWDDVTIGRGSWR